MCSSLCLSDDELHIMIKEQVLLVLRSRQQVDEALVSYHNELNHLDVNKCLRLLNERFGLDHRTIYPINITDQYHSELKLI